MTYGQTARPPYYYTRYYYTYIKTPAILLHAVLLHVHVRATTAGVDKRADRHTITHCATLSARVRWSSVIGSVNNVINTINANSIISVNSVVSVVSGDKNIKKTYLPRGEISWKVGGKKPMKYITHSIYIIFYNMSS